MISRTLVLILSFVTGAFSVTADVRLHNLFTDDMVLQRDEAVSIWGWADADDEITIEFRGQKAKAKNKAGKWTAKLKPLKAGGPDQLTVKVAKKGQPEQTAATLSRVMVGEVWIASGQSNMEWPMRASFEPQTEIPKARNAHLRLYTVPKLKAESPRDNIEGRWSECTPETAATFSAVAYYFARDLQQALGVPVGIIHTSWGGSPVEVWMSREVLSKNPDYKRDILDTSEASFAKYQQNLAAYKQEQEAAKKEGREFKKSAPRAGWRATELYNGMIAPLIPFTIKGAIWYQGESNAGRAWQYRTLFQDMIRNWRNDWGIGNFAFLEVQLAPFKAIKAEPAESDWAELREAQALAVRELPNVGMAVITDVGDERDIHPKKKEPVGARLALAARAIAYDEDIVYSGPVCKGMKVKGSNAVLSFAHVGGGLEARGGDLKGFAIAGEDRKFVWAKARIDGDKVVAASPDIPRPVAVRYGWADYPVVNLWNKDGLPASPFRTDDFPMITAPKKQ